MFRAAVVPLLVALALAATGCGGKSSTSSSNPNSPTAAPANISLSPASVASGRADLTLTITGLQFAFTNAQHQVNRVVWSANGSNTSIDTTFVSAAEIMAVIPADLLRNPVLAQIRVEVWDVQGDAPMATSSSVTFQVTSAAIPIPSISSISPSTVSASSADVTITIDGSNFGHYGDFVWSTAFWTTNGNLHDTGTWLHTTIISSSQLKAVIPAKLLQSPVSVEIVVMNGDVMGMSDGFFGYPRSNAVSFEVRP